MDDERGRSRSTSAATDPTRVLALSDGVFAIILTLLVWRSTSRSSAPARRSEALREIRPSLIAFLISFVVVAIAWAGTPRPLRADPADRSRDRLAELPVPAAAVDPAVRRGDARDVRARTRSRSGSTA